MGGSLRLELLLAMVLPGSLRNGCFEPGRLSAATTPLTGNELPKLCFLADASLSLLLMADLPGRSSASSNLRRFAIPAGARAALLVRERPACTGSLSPGIAAEGWGCKPTADLLA